MATRNFRALLEKKWDESKFVCVGLDPDWEKMPECVKRAAEDKTSPGNLSFGPAVVQFCRAMVEKTQDLVCAYKPNSAFFEEAGPEGMWVLAEVIHMIQTLAPEALIIGDNKRADIGNTNQGYAKGAFEMFDVDAITVNPYFGGGSLKPFLDYERKSAKVAKGDKGVIVLCRTSNPEAKEFQDRPTLVSSDELTEEFKLLSAAGVTTAEKMKLKWRTAEMAGDVYWVMPFYQWVAIRFAARWNGNGNCALVVGATASQELEDVRALVGDNISLLLPGIGFQQKGIPLEEQVEQTVKAAMNRQKRGFAINASRSVLYASGNEDFADAGRVEVLKMNELVRKYRN